METKPILMRIRGHLLGLWAYGHPNAQNYVTCIGVKKNKSQHTYSVTAIELGGTTNINVFKETLDQQDVIMYGPIEQYANEAGLVSVIDSVILKNEFPTIEEVLKMYDSEKGIKASDINGLTKDEILAIYSFDQLTTNLVQSLLQNEYLTTLVKTLYYSNQEEIQPVEKIGSMEDYTREKLAEAKNLQQRTAKRSDFMYTEVPIVNTGVRFTSGNASLSGSGGIAVMQEENEPAVINQPDGMREILKAYEQQRNTPSQKGEGNPRRKQRPVSPQFVPSPEQSIEAGQTMSTDWLDFSHDQRDAGPV